MKHIVVDDQQAKLITETKETLEIRDVQGRHLGYVAHAFTDEDIAIARQRLASGEPRYYDPGGPRSPAIPGAQMTRYTVVWARAAENDLAEIWTNARDRAAVTRAGNVDRRRTVPRRADQGFRSKRGSARVSRSAAPSPLHRRRWRPPRRSGSCYAPLTNRYLTAHEPFLRRLAPVPPEPDPVLKNARREAIIIGLVWLAATAYCCVYCYLFGYIRAGQPLGPQDVRPILGMPSWVFWGIMVPWARLCAVHVLVRRVLHGRRRPGQGPHARARERHPRGRARMNKAAGDPRPAADADRAGALHAGLARPGRRRQPGPAQGELPREVLPGQSLAGRLRRGPDGRGDERRDVHGVPVAGLHVRLGGRRSGSPRTWSRP